MEIKLINGHNQIIFSENDKKEIIGSYMSGESMRSIQRRYNISAKPLRRLLDENNIDHSRGNLRAYVKIIQTVFMMRILKMKFKIR